MAPRAVDHMGFSPYFVGSLRRWHTLCHMAAHTDILVHKHTHGEFGIAAAACHQILLTLPNLARGNQQTHQLIAHDILTEPLPIVNAASWGVIDPSSAGGPSDIPTNCCSPSRASSTGPPRCAARGPMALSSA
jgi:glucarate dehydratase